MFKNLFKNKKNDYDDCIVWADMALTEINLLQTKMMEIDMKIEQEELKCNN